MSLSNRIIIAAETLGIIRTGKYLCGEKSHDINGKIAWSIAGTHVVEYSEFPETGHKTGEIQIRNEATISGILRYFEESETREGHVAALNFASATAPGGGFETGAQAQEECLARASALYATQISREEEFYGKNVRENGPFYSDRMIWSPNVPFFRNEHDDLTEPFFASIITAAAPNQNRIPNEQKPQTESIFKHRIRQMLALAASHDVDHLILGAWGCGVFGNNPEDVANWFKAEILPRRHHFQSITFAIYCPNGPDANLLAFQKAFF